MAEAALATGWEFWRLEAHLLIQKAEAFHEALARQLWPRAVILYVESATTAIPVQPNAWAGSWVILAAPPLRTLSPTDLENLPGLFLHDKQPAAHWALLFPPSKN